MPYRVPCPARCSSGKVTVYDAEKKKYVQVDCGTCQGKGYLE